MGLFGKSSQEKAAEKNIKLQNEYNDKRYRFDKRQTKRQNRYNRKTVEIERENERVFREFGDAQRNQEYQDLLKIRNFEYGQQVRQYNESERIYGMQRGFNAQAEIQAKEAENRRYQEILTGMSFEQQDMLVQMLQQEGQAQARVGPGRSAAKVIGSNLAAYGRNQAVMAESLLSATKENAISNRQISMDRYGADLAAQSRRMLQPMRAPDPMAPLKLPQATIQNAYRLRTPPKAPNQRIGSSSPGFGQILGTGLQIAGGIASVAPGGQLAGAIMGGLGSLF